MPLIKLNATKGLTGNLPAVSGANLTGISAITEADMYRFNSDVSGDQDPFTGSNIERVDDATFSKIGNGVSYSSGKFTFGATGLYFVEVTIILYIDSSAIGNGQAFLEGTSDDFSNADELFYMNFGGDGNIERCTNTNSTLFNCTNTSTHKVRLKFQNMSGNNIQGSSTVTQSGIRFIRLGDSQ
jgi:hypothetical protein|tara:strand:+ start:589 stop:1140 length:552 start_codon:yes stop_codon:yes gene_type:complete